MSVTTTDERKILVRFDKRECISLKEAADIAGKSESTMRSWCVEEGLGRRVGGGTWMVSDTVSLKPEKSVSLTGPAVTKIWR
jgi:hypothetical protein